MLELIGMERIAIMGLGLIGASMALALKGKYYILGNDSDKQSLNYCLKNGIIDQAAELDDFTDVKAVFISVPLEKTTEAIEAVYKAVGDSAIISDLASIKGGICQAPCRYVGAHPMAGTEKKGAKAAKAHLFENAYCIIVPSQNDTDTQAITQIFIQAGAKPVFMSASEHDEFVSSISHVPHAVAYALSNSVLNAGFAGTGFLDTTRIALSDESFWTSIFKLNRVNVLKGIDNFIKELLIIKDNLQAQEYEQLRLNLKKARSKRQQLDTARFYLSEYILDVDIVNKVGEIGRITNILAQNNINITNIGIMNSREGSPGALRLAFEDEAGYMRALQLINEGET